MKTKATENRNLSVREENRHTAVNIERLRQIATPESEEELAIEKELTENGELYKTSMRIAMKVRRALRMSGMTQAVLSEKLGMDPSVVSKSLSGKANLELKTLIKLENALGINIIDRSISKPVSRPSYRINVFNVKNEIDITPVVETVRNKNRCPYPRLRRVYSTTASLNKRISLQGNLNKYPSETILSQR